MSSVKLTVFIICSACCTECNGLLDLFFRTARHVNICTFSKADLHCKERYTSTYARDENVLTSLNQPIDNDSPLIRKQH